MVGTWRVLSKTSPGTPTEFGSDDLDKVNSMFRGDTNVDTAEINSDFRFRDNKLAFRNPSNAAQYILRTSAIPTNRQTTLPLLTADDTFVFDNHAATLTNKILAGPRISNYLDYESTSTPANPGANVLRVYRRSSDNTLVYRNNAGTETSMAGGGGGAGEANTASNIGVGGVGVYKIKSGVDLQFKKINAATGGQITVTDDTTNNEVDVAVTPGGIDGYYMRTVGGAVTWDKPGKAMPDGSFYTGARWGTWLGGAGNGDGVLAGCVTQGTIDGDNGSTVSRTTFASAAVDQSLCGWSTAARMTRRSQTPRFKHKVAHNPSSERAWVGFLDVATYPKGANPLVNRSGLMCGFGESDTNFLIKWNNGGASPQSASTGIAKDTAYHAVELLLDEATGSVSAWFDGALTVNTNTTQAPATGTSLAIHNLGEAVGATAAGIRTEYAMITYP